MASVTAAGWAAIASAGVGAGATAYSINQQKDAQKEQEKAAEIEQRKAAIQNQRERRRAVAQNQAAQAQVQAAQAAQGGTTTGTDQTLGAMSSQTGGNLSFQQSLASMSNQQIQAQQSAQNSMARAQTAQAIGQLPGQFGFSPGSILANSQSFNSAWGNFFNRGS